MSGDPRLQLLDAIADAVAQATGMPVQRDRLDPLAEHELPAVLMHDGSERTVEVANAPAVLWALRWEVRPRIEVVLRGQDQAALRQQLATVVGQIIEAVRENPTVNSLLVRNSTPDCSVTPARIDGATMSRGSIVEFGFTIERS